MTTFVTRQLERRLDPIPTNCMGAGLAEGKSKRCGDPVPAGWGGPARQRLERKSSGRNRVLRVIWLSDRTRGCK